MTLRRFLDTAYYLLIEERRRLGIDLITALEDTKEFASGGGGLSQQEPTQAAMPNQVRQNDAALQEFAELTRGLKLA